jgi:uncharacterized protein YjbI with pentapeptide repeats
MANEKQLEVLRQGVVVWNEWREMHPEIREPDLREADLRGAMLRNANLFGAILYKSNLTKAILTKANLRGASLIRADLTKANLRGADLRWAQIIETTLLDAKLTGSYVYGAAVWDVEMNDRTKQQNLIITDRPHGLPWVTSGKITDPDIPEITVDNIKVAQFIYLLLNNREIRDVIDAVTAKGVLILGRFSKKRKKVLDALREELRKHNYLPILFDFDAPNSQTIIETVKTLAGMSRFVVADITDARSVLRELQIIDTHCRTVAVRLIKEKGAREYGTPDFRTSPWFVKGKYEYQNVEQLIASIKKNIIAPAEAKVRKLRGSET